MHDQPVGQDCDPPRQRVSLCVMARSVARAWRLTPADTAIAQVGDLMLRPKPSSSRCERVSGWEARLPLVPPVIGVCRHRADRCWRESWCALISAMLPQTSVLSCLAVVVVKDSFMLAIGRFRRRLPLRARLERAH